MDLSMKNSSEEINYSKEEENNNNSSSTIFEKGSRKETFSPKCSKNHHSSKPSFTNFLLFLIIIVTLFNISSSAPAAPYSKFKSPREKGCYYLLKHYENGQEIETNEPCLNCTCLNSMLMCYLRVCPYVRPLGDRCIIERVHGECCPRITCPDSSIESTTPEPDQSEGLGCYIDGEHYKEGAQIQSDPSKPCEVCYCIRNTSSCVVQECTLKVSGCEPLFSSDSCCPTRYNCSEEAATTVPPGLLHPSSPMLGCRANGKNYLDGEAVPSRDSCEHCYCMKNEIVCAVQECKAPCEGCVAIPSDNDQCCPERYECAAPTRVTNSTSFIDVPTTTTDVPSSVKSVAESLVTLSGIEAVKSEPTKSPAEVEPTTKSPIAESRVVLIPSQPRREEQGASRRRPFPSVGVIPGEGICRHEGRVYQNGDEVLSKNPCVEYCMCINSVVYCDETVCTEPKVRDGNCTRVKLPTDCCPRYECTPSTTTTTTTTLAPTTSTEAVSVSIATTEKLTTTTEKIEVPTTLVPELSETTTTAARILDKTDFSMSEESVEVSSTEEPSTSTSLPSSTSSVPLDIETIAETTTTATVPQVILIASSTEIPESDPTTTRTEEVADDRKTVSIAEADTLDKILEPTTRSPVVLEQDLTTVQTVSSSTEAEKSDEVLTDEVSTESVSIVQTSTAADVPSSSSERPETSTKIDVPIKELENEITTKIPEPVPIVDEVASNEIDDVVKDLEIIVTTTTEKVVVPLFEPSTPAPELPKKESVQEEVVTQQPTIAPAEVVEELVTKPAEQPAVVTTAKPLIQLSTSTESEEVVKVDESDADDDLKVQTTQRVPVQDPQPVEVTTMSLPRAPAEIVVPEVVTVAEIDEAVNDVSSEAVPKEPEATTLPTEVFNEVIEFVPNQSKAKPVTETTAAPTTTPLAEEVVPEKFEEVISIEMTTKLPIEDKAVEVPVSVSEVPKKVLDLEVALPVAVTEIPTARPVSNEILDEVAPATSPPSSSEVYMESSTPPPPAQSSSAVPLVIVPMVAEEPATTLKPAGEEVVEVAEAGSLTMGKSSTAAPVVEDIEETTTAMPRKPVMFPIGDSKSIDTKEPIDVDDIKSEDEKSVEEIQPESIKSDEPITTAQPPVAITILPSSLDESSESKKIFDIKEKPEIEIETELPTTVQSRPIELVTMAPVEEVAEPVSEAVDDTSSKMVSKPEIVDLSKEPELDVTTPSKSVVEESDREEMTTVASSSIAPDAIRFEEVVPVTTDRVPVTTERTILKDEEEDREKSIVSSSFPSDLESVKLVPTTSTESVPIAPEVKPLVTEEPVAEDKEPEPTTISPPAAENLVMELSTELPIVSSSELSTASSSELPTEVPTVSSTERPLVPSSEAPVVENVSSTTIKGELDEATTIKPSFGPTTTIQSIEVTFVPTTMATPVSLNISSNGTADYLVKEVTSSPVTSTIRPMGNGEQLADAESNKILEEDDGSCVFEGKVYQSAEQIPRPHPCDFCFCFRGDIICLQQTCPPPIPRCYETPIQGFCCPRYECPVQSTISSNATTPRSVESPKGCQVNGSFYEIGERIQQSSGPCLECKCDHSGLMQCDPQTCSPPAPLLLRMNRDFFASTIRR